MVDFTVIATLVVSVVDLIVNAIIVPFSTGTLDISICGKCFEVHHESVTRECSSRIGSDCEDEEGEGRGTRFHV